MPFIYWDPTYVLVVLAALISLAVSASMNATFRKYQSVRSLSGLTGEQAALRILQAAGIYDVSIRRVSGNLTDHYDPRSNGESVGCGVWTVLAGSRGRCGS